MPRPEPNSLPIGRSFFAFSMSWGILSVSTRLPRTLDRIRHLGAVWAKGATAKMNTEQVAALTVWATTSLPRGGSHPMARSRFNPMARSRFTRVSQAKMAGITAGFAEAPINFLRVRKEGGPGRGFGHRQRVVSPESFRLLRQTGYRNKFFRGSRGHQCRDCRLSREFGC
jgi:hypothetical protein